MMDREPEGQPVAVLLPGGRYTAQAPLLYWCAEMLSELGWHVQAVEWAIEDSAPDDPQRFVEQAVTDAFAATLISVPAANHSLTVPGDWRRSLIVQRDVFEGIARHLDTM